MTDLADLQTELLTAIAAAGDVGALESLRIGALGKQGRVTALLKTLGGMSPEQRLADGPPIQALREAVTAAIAERKVALESEALDARLASERLDLSLPVAMTMVFAV